MPAVLFVCTANQCRSPMAGALLRSRLEQQGDAGSWQIESAGVWATEGIPALENARIALRERGLSLDPHRSRNVDQVPLYSFDLILTMEQGQKEALRAAFPEIAARIYLLSELAGPAYSIPDPVGGTLADFYGTIRELDDLLERGLERIRELAREQSLLPPG